MKHLIAIALFLAVAVQTPTASADEEPDPLCSVQTSLQQADNHCSFTPHETAGFFSSGDGHEYTITPACEIGGQTICSNTATCTGTPPPTLYSVLRDGVEIGTTCLDHKAAEALGKVTPLLVQRAFERLTWPSSELVIQPPDGSTLVGFATNFYTGNSTATTQAVTLLGRRIEIEAMPTSYVWKFGDGSEQTTASPGAAYPDLLVTHRYTDAGVTVRPSVDTVYAGRYRVGRGAWQPIPDTLTVTGTPAALRVHEAQGVLVGSR